MNKIEELSKSKKVKWFCIGFLSGVGFILLAGLALTII